VAGGHDQHSGDEQFGSYMARWVGVPRTRRKMGSPSRCGDLCPRWRTTQVINHGAAYADGLPLGQRSSEDVCGEPTIDGGVRYASNALEH
jgi:hypothetical protein